MSAAVAEDRKGRAKLMTGLKLRQRGLHRDGGAAETARTWVVLETDELLDTAFGLGNGATMPTKDRAAVPSLVESLETYLAEIPPPERADALHQVFYGFYTRVAIIDRTTHELAAWAKDEATMLADTPGPLTEALRDNSLFVGQELFEGRMRAMTAMGYISKRLISLLNGAPPPVPFTLTQAIALDQESGPDADL